MKKLLATLILIFAFCIVVFSQNNQTVNCPTANVRGGGIPKFGEITYFTTDVSGISSENLIYNWKVTVGKIIKGQGTSVIEVQVPDYWSDNLMAEVEIEGFPEGCSNKYVEMAVIVDSPKPYLIERFSSQATRIDKAQLDNLISELQNNPSATAYIIEYFARNTPQKVINQKIRKIWNYLINVKKQDKEKFKILISSLDENMTVFWIIPNGAEFPKP